MMPFAHRKVDVSQHRTTARPGTQIRQVEEEAALVVFRCWMPSRKETQQEPISGRATTTAVPQKKKNVFCLAFTFQLLVKLWSQVSSLPPGTCLQFLSRIGVSIPIARRLSQFIANSRFRAFRESMCAQEEIPTNLYEYALGMTRNHEINL